VIPLVIFLLAPVPASVQVQATPTRATRLVLSTIEKTFDTRLSPIEVTDPVSLMGNTHGVYLAGYGVVFTSEVNLVGAAVLTPFRSEFSPQELAKLRQKKLDRIPILKEHMRAALTAAGAVLDNLAPDEQVVLALSLFYFKWERTDGLPAQIVMQAPRKALLDASKGNTAALDTALRVQEY
jgi:hypothetical protein